MQSIKNFCTILVSARLQYDALFGGKCTQHKITKWNRPTDRQTDERQRQNCSSQRQQDVVWPVSCYQWPGLQSMCITSITAFTDDKATTNGRSGKL